MDKKYLRTHISNQFNRDFQVLQKKFKRVTSLLGSQFDIFIEGLGQMNSQQLKKSAKKSTKVRAVDYDINDLCFQIIALRGPVASDLRIILSYLNVSRDITQISFELRKLSSIFKKHDAVDQQILDALIEYITRVNDLMKTGFEAFDQIDTDSTYIIIRSKKELEQLYKSATKKILSLEDAANVSQASAMDYHFVLMSIQRIAWLIRNVAKYVIYIQYGIDVRFEKNSKLVEILSGQES